VTSEQARELFSVALDGELSPDERAAFDAALAADATLAEEYAAFRATLSAAQRSLAEPADTRDLLPGVQRRLRARSRGRFYADKFAERAGRGLVSPFTLALVMGVIAALAWLAFGYVQGIDLRK
jgi:anti-sigma factor RsiW